MALTYTQESGVVTTLMIENFLKVRRPSLGCNVIEVQASGDELGYILEQFTNLPMFRSDADSMQNKSEDPMFRTPMPHARNYIMTWHGDFAKFIMSNL